MRSILIITTGLFSGVSCGVSAFWATGVSQTVFWAILGILGGLWGKYVHDEAYR